MIVMQTLAILFIQFIFASSTGSGLADLGDERKRQMSRYLMPAQLIQRLISLGS